MLKAGPYQLKTSPWSSHGRILRALSSTSRDGRILDVGAAQGHLGASLRAQGFTHLVALEQDAARASAARSAGYETVVTADLDYPENWGLVGRFDVIICADVLEHLRDPWAVLGCLTQLLVPGGFAIVSIPNSGHWWMRANVALGRFPFDDRGLFDRTHLRFFTKTEARRLLMQAGLRIDREWNTAVPFTLIVRAPVMRTASIAVEALYCAFSSLWSRLFAYQFVFVTHRPM